MGLDQANCRKLRSFLIEQPHPAKLRIRTDDDERFIAIGANPRNRWPKAVATISASEPRAVDCLDKDGDVLRTISFGSDDEDDSPRETRAAVAKANEIAAIATILDRQGARQNEAYEKGAQAASSAQEQLIAIVQTLTEHLSAAIMNLHNVSVNFAHALSGQEPPDPGERNNQLVAGILGQLAARAVAPGAEAPPNGSGGKKR